MVRIFILELACINAIPIAKVFNLLNSSDITGGNDTLETVDIDNDSLIEFREQNVKIWLNLLENEPDGSYGTFREASTAHYPVCSENRTVIGRIHGLTLSKNTDREDEWLITASGAVHRQLKQLN